MKKYKLYRKSLAVAASITIMLTCLSGCKNKVKTPDKIQLSSTQVDTDTENKSIEKAIRKDMEEFFASFPVLGNIKYDKNKIDEVLSDLDKKNFMFLSDYNTEIVYKFLQHYIDTNEVNDISKISFSNGSKNKTQTSSYKYTDSDNNDFEIHFNTEKENSEYNTFLVSLVYKGEDISYYKYIYYHKKLNKQIYKADILDFGDYKLQLSIEPPEDYQVSIYSNDLFDSSKINNKEYLKILNSIIHSAEEKLSFKNYAQKYSDILNKNFSLFEDGKQYSLIK